MPPLAGLREQFLERAEELGAQRAGVEAFSMNRLLLDIALAYQRGEGSLRQLAARYSTSAGTVQRCVASYQGNLAKASAAA